jgi:hypothetical protein
MSIKFKPTQAVLDNISRGVALSKKYQRESLAGQQRIQQVNITKSYLDCGFDIKAVSNIYHTLSKLEKSIKPDTRLWDGGCTDDVIKYYAHGGKAGLAWSKLILKEQGMLVSQTREITKAETEEVETDSVGSIGVLKAVDVEKRLATFVILEAQDEDGYTTDLHSDTYTLDEIEKAAHSFNIECRKASLFHQIETTSFEFRESYIAPANFIIGEQFVRKGSWLGVIYVSDDEIWEGIKSGEYNGLSIQCMATVHEIE